jgi:positive regulator of sigma E activity
MKERGIAIKIEGSVATVRISMSEGCGACASSDGCAVLGREIDADIMPGQDIAEGDMVELEISNATSAVGALWILALPLALFFAAYLGLGAILPTGGEGIRAIAGLVGFAAGLGIAALAARRGRLSKRPTARRIELEPSGSGEAESPGIDESDAL